MPLPRCVGPIVVGLCASLPAAGATPPAADRTTAAFRTLALSANLARAGTRTRDPLLLLAAARLRAGVAVQGGDDRAARWIAAAEALGVADPRIASLAADLRSEATKGRAAGPRVTASLVRAGQAMRFTERFRAGATAVVYVEGDGDSDLALQVGGPSGVACSETGPGDVKICTWTPSAADPVRVEISNVGAVQNRFILGTN